MIRIEISGADHGEVVANLRGLLSSMENPPQTTAAPKDDAKSGKPASGRTRAAAAPKDEGKPAISTGEERVNPEDAKQDAADEAAERPVEIKLSHDSIRALLGGYVMAYGMEAAQADGPKLLGKAKISDIPLDEKSLAAAVIAIATGIEKNPEKRTMNGDGLTPEKSAELKPLVLHAQALLK